MVPSWRLADAPFGMTIIRFGKTIRWFHGSFALAFLILAATGAALALRGTLDLDPALGAMLLYIHQIAAVCLVVLPTWVLLSGNTHEALSDLAEVVRWRRHDLRWLALKPLAVLGWAELPPAGKLNAGQKLNAILTALITTGLLASGAILWVQPGALLPLAIHVALFAAWLPVFCGHLFLALVLPATRPALRGMITGRVPRSWAAHHHPAWLAELEGDPVRPEAESSHAA